MKKILMQIMIVLSLLCAVMPQGQAASARGGSAKNKVPFRGEFTAEQLEGLSVVSTDFREIRSELKQQARELAIVLASLQTENGGPGADTLRREAKRILVRSFYLMNANYLAGHNGGDSRVILKRLWWASVPLIAAGLFTYLKVNYHDIPWFSPVWNLPAYKNIYLMGRVSDVMDVLALGHIGAVAGSATYRNLIGQPGTAKQDPRTMLREVFARTLMGALRQQSVVVELSSTRDGDYASVEEEIRRLVGDESTANAAQGRYAGQELTEEQARQELQILVNSMAQSYQRLQNMSLTQGDGLRSMNGTILAQEIAREYRDAQSLIFQARITQPFLRRTASTLRVMRPVRMRLRRFFLQKLSEVKVEQEQVRVVCAQALKGPVNIEEMQHELNQAAMAAQSI